jgi:hypothetical protein
MLALWTAFGLNGYFLDSTPRNFTNQPTAECGFQRWLKKGKRARSLSKSEFQEFLTILGIFGQLMPKTYVFTELIAL